MKKVFTPKEAAQYLTERAGREISIARVAQMRREGKLKGTAFGNNTIYTQRDLDKADITLHQAGRKPRGTGRKQELAEI